MSVQDSEEESLKDEGMDEGDAADEAFVEDGESTDAESDNSNEDLNVHQFLAELEAEFDKLHGQADLDHTDAADFALQEEEEEGDEETLGQEGFEDTLGMLGAPGGASDEELEREPSDAEAVPPPPPPADMTRRRLRGKQRPPVPYQNAPAPVPARKRHGLLKQPSRKTKPSKTCEGYQERSCRFSPQQPGQAARVQPSRGIKTCVFCSPERMREAHGGSRPAALKDLFVFKNHSRVRVTITLVTTCSQFRSVIV